MDSTLAQVRAAIEPASDAAASKAHRRLQGRRSLGRLYDGAICLAGARHVSTPPVDRKRLIVCAADHGQAGESSTEVVNAIAAGAAEVNVLARAAGTPVAVVDCGMHEPSALAPAVLSVPIAPGGTPPPMSIEQAVTALETGIALVLSFAGEGLDLLAIGQASTPGAGAAAGRLGQALIADAEADALALLAEVGSFDIAVATGLCLAAAAIRIPVVLDGAGAPAAGLMAVRLAPAARGYLLAGHPGIDDSARAALAALELQPLIDLHMTASDGTTAAAALPAVDAAARLLREPAHHRRLRIVDSD